MIDTIVLTLKTGMFTILDHDKFSPSTKGLYDATAGYYRLGGRSNITCKQNPTKGELLRATMKKNEKSIGQNKRLSTRKLRSYTLPMRNTM